MRLHGRVGGPTRALSLPPHDGTLLFCRLPSIQMGSFFYRVLLLVGVTAPIVCMSASNFSPSNRESPRPPSVKSNPASKVSPSNTVFAFSLYQRLVQENPGQNILFSPVSISTSLAMLSLGARSATKTQILRSLGFDLLSTPEPTIHLGFEHLVHSLNVCHKDRELRMGSVLFIRKELQLQANFLDRVKKLYGTKVFSEDFSDTYTAQARINRYVEKETKGKVVDVIQDLDSQTAMVLVNHIFFKGEVEFLFSSFLLSFFPFPFLFIYFECFICLFVYFLSRVLMYFKMASIMLL